MNKLINRFDLKSKRVVVTGGSGQLGQSMARALLEAGAAVILADVTPLSPAKMKKLQTIGSGKISAAVLDVTSASSFETFIHRVESKSSKIDVWVNNAGVAVFTPFKDRTEAELEQVLDINVKGVSRAIKAITPFMARRKKGTIVNIASIYGLVSPDPRVYADSKRNSSEIYGASKAAVIQLTKYFAVHLAPYQIRVNCVSPGGVFNNQATQFVKNYSHRTPLGRLANEDEIANGVVFLASDACPYLTGHNLVIDGGLSAW